MKKLSVIFICSLFLMAISGCQESEMTSSQMGEGPNAPLPENNPKARDMVWVDGKIFGTVVTPATFEPESGNFDELYKGGFKDGIGLISEAKPGDQDYNGGRWHLNLLKGNVDPAKYADADRVEDLDPDDFISTANYFECPLQPK